MHNIVLHALSQLSNVTVEGYKEAQAEFSVLSDPMTASTTIARYKELVDRNQAHHNERNIDWWRKQGWEQFKNFVDTKVNQKSATQEKRSKLTGKSITLDETRDWLIVIPLDKDASCYHGKYTNWCTAKQSAPQFERFHFAKNTTLIYFLNTTSGDKWAIAITVVNKIAYFDSKDNLISKLEFDSQTGLDSSRYVSLSATANHQEALARVRLNYNQEVSDITKELQNVTDSDPTIERQLWKLKRFDLMLQYCIQIHKRWAKFEDAVIRSIEGVIDANTLDTVIEYCTNVIRGRWIEIERYILTTPQSILQYTTQIMRGRWSAAESQLLAFYESGRGNHALLYAYANKDGFWSELEDAILARLIVTHDCTDAFDYLTRVVQDEWPELEEQLNDLRLSQQIAQYHQILTRL